MSNTSYFHDTDPVAFARRVQEHLRARYRVQLLWVRPRADGTVFCLAKMRRSFLAGLRWWLKSRESAPVLPPDPADHQIAA